jgi:hypothetical protein
LRQQLLDALVMADGKDRQTVLEEWETDLYAPLGGWQQADDNLLNLLLAAPD